MAKKMTIDDLIAVTRKMEYAEGQTDLSDSMEGYNRGLMHVIDLIETNRSDLEASMKNALTFRVGEPLYPGMCRMVDLKGQYIESQPWITTNEAISLTNDIGFWAEFVDGEK